jgi:hypothetical protein
MTLPISVRRSSVELAVAHALDEHGRGLAVIDALSNRWGTGRLSDDYKVVWAELLV